MTAGSAPCRFASLEGTVDAFDERAGHGTIRTDDGAEVFFHCISIADGSRTIPAGARVTARSEPVGLGTWEAVEVRSISRG